MNKIAATIISLIICITILLTGWVLGYSNAYVDNKEKLNKVGIERIEKHYTETDGVRYNWYEIVWIESKLK